MNSYAEFLARKKIIDNRDTLELQLIKLTNAVSEAQTKGRIKGLREAVEICKLQKLSIGHSGIGPLYGTGMIDGCKFCIGELKSRIDELEKEQPSPNQERL